MSALRSAVHIALATLSISMCTHLAMPPSAMAEESEYETASGSTQVRTAPSRTRRVYDATILRPLAFGNLVGAAAVYPIAYPVSLVTGGTDQVQQYCWDVPAERVFSRPLGEL